MVIKNKDHRIYIDHDNEEKLFSDEHQYYTKNKALKVCIQGNERLNIYKNINLQIVLTYKCNYDCSFCIEKNNHREDENYDKAFKTLKNVIKDYEKYNIKPNVTITGGEPTLYHDEANEIIDFCNEKKLRVNINSNGYNLKKIKSECLKNISVQKTKDIFVKNCFVQRIIFNGENNIKSFMDFYINKKCAGFSFRGLSTKKRKQAHSFFNVLNNLKNDKDFIFLKQKIGDHYLYEIYSYKNYYVRFTYSNFDFLHQKECREKLPYTRANIIDPSGKLYFSWNSI